MGWLWHYKYVCKKYLDFHSDCQLLLHPTFISIVAWKESYWFIFAANPELCKETAHSTVSFESLFIDNTLFWSFLYPFRALHCYIAVLWTKELFLRRYNYNVMFQYHPGCANPGVAVNGTGGSLPCIPDGNAVLKFYDLDAVSIRFIYLIRTF